MNDIQTKKQKPPTPPGACKSTSGAGEKCAFELTLRPEPPGPDYLGRPPAYRLKLLLKSMLRSYGLRCTSMAETGISSTE